MIPPHVADVVSDEASTSCLGHGKFGYPAFQGNAAPMESEGTRNFEVWGVFKTSFWHKLLVDFAYFAWIFFVTGGYAN